MTGEPRLTAASSSPNPVVPVAESITPSMILSEFSGTTARPRALSRVAREVAPPLALVVAFSLAGLFTQTMTYFQILALMPVVYSMAVFSVGVMNYRRDPDPALPAIAYDLLPTVSILIPAHNEEAVIANTVAHMLRLDYPRLEVIVIDDHSSDRTGDILRHLAAAHANGDIPVHVVTRRNLPNRGKSEALNCGLEVARGEIVCVFDADSEIDGDFLRRAVAPLVRDPGVCGVQAQVRMYNRKQNLLTQMQDDEFALYNEITQVGRDQLGMASALGGNGQLTRKAAVQAVGGWSPRSLTEDLDLTMRLFLEGQGRIAHCTAAVVWQEGVPTFGALIRQRTRWAEGMLQCWAEFAGRVLTSSRMPLRRRFDAWYALFSGFLPLLTAFSLLYTTLSFVPGVFERSLPPAFTLALTVFSLALACTWSMIVTFKRERALDPLPGLRFLVYVIHWTPALVLALRNVFTDRPVVWHKTEHVGAGSAPAHLVATVPQATERVLVHGRETRSLADAAS